MVSLMLMIVVVVFQTHFTLDRLLVRYRLNIGVGNILGTPQRYKQKTNIIQSILLQKYKI